MTPVGQVEISITLGNGAAGLLQPVSDLTIQAGRVDVIFDPANSVAAYVKDKDGNLLHRAPATPTNADRYQVEHQGGDNRLHPADYRLDAEEVLAAAKTITGATNASPIVITATGHGYSTGDNVKVSGVAGNTAANGRWTITVIDANSFSLNGSAGNAAYTSGGQAEKITPQKAWFVYHKA